MAQSRPTNVMVNSCTVRLHPLRNPRAHDGRIPERTPLCIPTTTTSTPSVPAVPVVHNDRVDDVRLTKMLQQYREIVNRVNRGEAVGVTCDRLEWSDWTYKRNKTIAEVMLADPVRFKRGYDQLVQRDLNTIFKLARKIILTPTCRIELENLRSVGQILV